MNNWGGYTPHNYRLSQYGHAETQHDGGNVAGPSNHHVAAASQAPPASPQLLAVQREIDALRPTETAIRDRLRFAPTSTMSSQEVATISRISALRHQRTQLVQAAQQAPSQQQGRTAQRSVYQMQYLQQPTAHGPLGVGSAFMLGHGTLQVLSSTQGRGGLIYNAVYTPAMAMTIASSSYSDFRPIQDALVAEHLESYREDISDAESAMGVDPIRATLTPEGNFAITDGHHRLAAAASLNRAINVKIDPRIEPGQARADWSQVKTIHGEG